MNILKLPFFCSQSVTERDLKRPEMGRIFLWEKRWRFTNNSGEKRKKEKGGREVASSPTSLALDNVNKLL